jgi:hypothetical protein
VQVLETLVRLKKNDPILKQPDVVLFPQPEGSEGDAPADAAAADGKKSKPMYLRTVLAKQVGEGGSRRRSCAAGIWTHAGVLHDKDGESM